MSVPARLSLSLGPPATRDAPQAAATHRVRLAGLRRNQKVPGVGGMKRLTNRPLCDTLSSIREVIDTCWFDSDETVLSKRPQQVRSRFPFGF